MEMENEHVGVIYTYICFARFLSLVSTFALSPSEKTITLRLHSMLFHIIIISVEMTEGIFDAAGKVVGVKALDRIT